MRFEQPLTVAKIWLAANEWRTSLIYRLAAPDICVPSASASADLLVSRCASTPDRPTALPNNRPGIGACVATNSEDRNDRHKPDDRDVGVLRSVRCVQARGNRLINSCAVKLFTVIRLRRDVLPEVIATSDRVNPRALASILTSSTFAASSTGADESLTFKEPSDCHPTISVFGCPRLDVNAKGDRTRVTHSISTTVTSPPETGQSRPFSSLTIKRPSGSISTAVPAI